MKTKKIFSAILCVLLVLSVMCSCRKTPSSDSSGYYYDVSYITTTVPGENEDGGNNEKENNTSQNITSSGNTSNNSDGGSKIDLSGTGDRFDVDLSGVTIKIMLGGKNDDWEQEIYDEFCAKTGAKIKYVSNGSSTVTEKLAALVAANDAPDGTFMDVSASFPSYITRGLIQPVTSFINKKTDTWLAYDIMDVCKYNNEYYGITDHYWGASYYVYYNKDIIENDINVKKTPKQLYEEGNWTWDTFFELAKTLTKKDSSNNVIQYGCLNSSQDVFMLSAGAAAAKYDNGKFVNTLNSTAMKDAWNMHRKLSKDGYMYQANSQSIWTNGKAAMNIYPHYTLRRSQNSEKTKSWAPFNWDVVPVPSYTNGKSYTPLGAQMGVIPAKAKNPEAGALLWLYRAYCQENQKTIKNENAEQVAMFKKAVTGGSLFFSLDTAVVGTGYYKDFADSSVSLQTAIDSWSSHVDGKIVEYEKEQKQFKPKN